MGLVIRVTVLPEAGRATEMDLSPIKAVALDAVSSAPQ